MRRRKAALILATLTSVVTPAVAGPQTTSGERVIDVRAGRPPAGNSFEALWQAYKRADEKGDAETAQNALVEIRRLRIERNIRSLESVALARVAEGVAALEAGDRGKAEERFRDATALDPYLPDGHFGVALAELKKGPFGVITAIRPTLAGTASRLTSARGAHYLQTLLVTVGLLALFATVTIFAIAMALRHATLLLHDLEESFGSGRGALARGVCALLLLLPLIAFQGWGWLPLWWLALLFIYMGPLEKGVTAVVVALCLLVGPVVSGMESRLRTQGNPLFRASMLAIEGEPDSRAAAALEEAVRDNPDDRDLVYLLALQYRRAGRYEDAAGLYREVLRTTPADPIALNNLANLEFSAGEFPAAIARYKQGIESSPPAEQAATFYYNLSLAHLQRFEYQPAQEARSQADRLSSGLVRSYDNTWKYEKGDYAVVDLGLSDEEVWSKYAGMASGLRAKNLAGGDVSAPLALGGGFLNRFAAFPLVFVLVVLVLRRWRGSKAFTMRCFKCGTPFCRRCHLGAVAGGLCTQCHHLFVVRDGVSGPARNQKLLEVQKEDERRDRVFRLLSLLSPGAGHLYAHRTLLGLLFVFLWAAILAGALLAGRVLPVTEAAGALTRPWGLGVAAVLLLALYVVANRSRPDFEILMPTRRPPSAARRREA